MKNIWIKINQIVVWGVALWSTNIEAILYHYPKTRFYQINSILINAKALTESRIERMYVVKNQGLYRDCR